MRLCVRVIDPVLELDAAMWGNATESWVPPALDWLGTLAAAGVSVSAGPDASHDDGEGLLLLPDPDAMEVPIAPGRPVLTGTPPEGTTARLDAVRDKLGALVTPDLRNVLVLRVDDPGAAVKDYLEGWRHDDVSPEAWSSLWGAVGPRGKVSLFCCTGFVREDGSVVDSRAERPAEWRLLDEGVARGVAALECHGHTHMHPDLQSWRSARDRFTADVWYREFWPPGLEMEPSVEAQVQILQRWQQDAGPGTSVVAPGEAWGEGTVVASRRRGFQIFNSWALCRLQMVVPTWTRGIGSPYLDRPDAVHLADGLPAIGYWHDRDMAVHGPDWAVDWLDAWRDCGARRMWSFDRLAAAYAEDVIAFKDGDDVKVVQAPAVPLRVELAH
jgi:hypothetical protein